MKSEPEIFSKRDREAEAASIARARADVAAGRVVEHAKVAEWLKAWASGKRKPMPREWLE